MCAGRGLGIKNDLRYPIAVPQVDEDQVAVVAAIGDPAKKYNLVSVVLKAEGATVVGALQFINKSGHGASLVARGVGWLNFPEAAAGRGAARSLPTGQIVQNFAKSAPYDRAEPVKRVSLGTAPAPSLRTSALRTRAPAWVRYLAFALPLLATAAFGRSGPLFRSDEAVLAALAQSQSWSGGLSTLLGRWCLSVPLGDISFRLAGPSMLGAGLLGLACFDFSYVLFRAQGGYSRLDPWLAWGASLIGALSLPAASEGTVAGGASLAPALSLLIGAQLWGRGMSRDFRSLAVLGLASGALLSESVHCAVLLLLGCLMMGTERVRTHLSKLLVFVSALVGMLAFIASKNGWFSHVPAFTTEVAAQWSPGRPLAWLQAMGILWCLGAGVALLFSLTDRRLIYVLGLLALADWALPSSGDLGWARVWQTDVSRAGLHLYLLGYLACVGALGLRTLGEAAQAVGLLGARQLSTLISVVAVAGSLAAAEDALMTLSQTEALGAEAWSEEVLQSLPPRSLVITESATRGRRLRAAQLQGARPDVLVVPLSELTQARNVRRWLLREPALHLLLVDLSLGHLPSERALAQLVDTRPVYVEPNPHWDRRLLEHLEPALPLSRLSSHALARSDRLAALSSVTPSIDRIMRGSRAGLRSDEATLSLFAGDVEQLHTTLARVDHPASDQLTQLSPFTARTEPVDQASQPGEPVAAAN